MGSRPVRIGNAAHDQKQLDIYGEVVNAAIICRNEGVKLSGDEKSFLGHLAKYVLQHWREPDAGIWETRQGDSHHLHSKAMCWLALDRASSLARRGELDLPADALAEEAGKIRALIHEQGFNPALGAYTATLQGDELDAAVLRLPLVGFEKASDVRMAGTIEAVRRRLAIGDLVYRHASEETRGEGAFLLCSFWLLQCLALQGRVDEAERMFDQLCARANDVGLYSEEVDPVSGEFLGNFPQAYTHVGLINSALRLQEARKIAEETRLGHP
jgi:GH15 family glucan-1,4-alpha-glucosidase